MKITLVTGAFLPVPPVKGGAVEKVWFALAKEFARRGHDITMISRLLPGWAEEETSEGVHHLRARGHDTPDSLLLLKLLDLGYSLRVRRLLPPADILVSNTFWLPLLRPPLSRGRLYIHVGRFPKGQLRFYTNAARLHALSPAIGDAIISEVPEMAERVRVIPFPVETGPPPSPFRGRSPIITYAGRVHPEKGVHLLVEAFAAAWRGPLSDWTLRIVGPWETGHGGGGEPYLARLKETAGDAPVVFTGGLFADGALARELQQARLFVYPSLAERGETFGVAALEAMAAGCAVLVSDLACFRGFVRENETGFVFDHRRGDKARALQEKLVALAGDESRLAEISDKGYRETARFSLSNMADLFLADFQSLLSQHERATHG